MIRNYQPDDLPRLKQIANKAWRGIYAMFHERYGDELFSLITPDPERGKDAQLEQHCAAHPDWVYVCEKEGGIIGFVTFLLDSTLKIGEIGNNAVDPDCGVKGVGQQMYQAVFERFKQEGMRFARVQTGLDDAHAPARRAYERAGFNIHHENVNYYKKL